MGCTTSIPIEYDDSSYIETQEWRDFKEEKVELATENGSSSQKLINLCSWIHKSMNVKGIILCSHGLHEHIVRYHKIADVLSRDGWAVYGADHFAHGLSYGTRGLITDYRFLVDDFAQIAKIVRSRHEPNLPFFVVAHSMGTLVAINSSVMIDNMAGIVLSGVSLFPGPSGASPFGIESLYSLGQSSVGVVLAQTMASIDPKGAAAPIKIESLTTPNSEEIAILMKDSRRFVNFSISRLSLF